MSAPKGKEDIDPTNLNPDHYKQFLFEEFPQSALRIDSEQITLPSQLGLLPQLDTTPTKLTTGSRVNGSASPAEFKTVENTTISFNLNTAPTSNPKFGQSTPSLTAQSPQLALNDRSPAPPSMGG